MRLKALVLLAHRGSGTERRAGGKSFVGMSVLELGGVPVYLFGSIVALGVFLALAVARWSVALYDEPFVVAVDITLAGIFFSLLGARAVYALLYWEGFSGDPMGIFRVWEGGYSLYGAALGLFAAMAIVCRRASVSLWRWLDVLAPSLALLLAIYALSAFFMQGLVGAPVPPALIHDRLLAEYVEFAYRPAGFEEHEYFCPVALYQAGLYFALFLTIAAMTRLPWGRGLWREGGLGLLMLAAAALIRFAGGFFYLAAAPGLHHGQILALLAAAAASGGFFWRQRRVPYGMRRR